MTEEQYWDKDATLVIYYRQAEELRKERTNEEFWLQGLYVYDAISRLVPVLHAFAKKGTKPQPYVEEPYPINKKKVEDAQAKKEKAKAEKGKAYMEGLMAQYNKRFKDAENKNEGR